MSAPRNTNTNDTEGDRIDPRLAEALGMALGGAAQQSGALWARVTTDLDELRRRLCIADNRWACRAFAHEAEDAVFDAIPLLRAAVADDEDWPALRDARIAGILRTLATIREATSVVPGVLTAGAPTNQRDEAA